MCNFFPDLRAARGPINLQGFSALLGIALIVLAGALYTSGLLFDAFYLIKLNFPPDLFESDYHRLSAEGFFFSFPQGLLAFLWLVITIILVLIAFAASSPDCMGLRQLGVIAVYFVCLGFVPSVLVFSARWQAEKAVEQTKFAITHTSSESHNSYQMLCMEFEGETRPSPGVMVACSPNYCAFLSNTCVEEWRSSVVSLAGIKSVRRINSASECPQP